MMKQFDGTCEPVDGPLLLDWIDHDVCAHDNAKDCLWIHLHHSAC